MFDANIACFSKMTSAKEIIEEMLLVTLIMRVQNLEICI